MEESFNHGISSEMCPICYCNYDSDTHKPTTLVCGHSLCIECGRVSRRCPMCKKKNKNQLQLQPNYVMMKMVDNDHRYKLKCVELVKQKSPYLWYSVKDEENKLTLLSRKVNMEYEDMKDNLKKRRQKVEEDYNEYMNHWMKNYLFLVQSQEDNNKMIDGFRMKLNRISSDRNILKALDDRQKSLDQYLVECKKKFDKFIRKSLKWKPRLPLISLVDPKFHDHRLDITFEVGPVIDMEDEIKNVSVLDELSKDNVSSLMKENSNRADSYANKLWNLCKKVVMENHLRDSEGDAEGDAERDAINDIMRMEWEG